MTYIPYAESSANAYRAMVLQPSTMFPVFCVGDFTTVETALQYAQDYALDQEGIPHVRAVRSLTNRELNSFGVSSLYARDRFLLHNLSNKASNERARIHHIQSRRELPNPASLFWRVNEALFAGRVAESLVGHAEPIRKQGGVMQ